MMLNCVAQLHGRGVIHQDIKPSNFLFGRDGSIKLCDFNLSRVSTDATRANGGTLLYFSPQKFNNTDDGYAADWWALGVTLYQALHGLQTWPFSARSLQRIGKLPAEEQLALVRKAVLKANLRFRPLSGVPRAARTLLRGLLHPRSEHRWGLVQVLAGDYPADQAFSAVALRFPHLGPDMERLLAVRRLCRAGLSAWQPVPWAFEEQGGVDAREPRDAKPSARVSTLHSLRALSSCLLTRKRAYKCSSSPRPAPEVDDLSPNDQLGCARGSEAGGKLEEPPRPGMPRAPCGDAGPGFRVANAEAPAIPASRFPQRGARSETELKWTSRTARCLPGAFSGAKSSWRRALLLPRSDAAVRAAAGRALSAAAAPVGSPALLTQDGRLTEPPFVPCEVRTHTLDLAAVCQALATSNAAGAGCADSEQPREEVAAAAGRAAAASVAGQVQGVEVLEEMRLMLERRRLSSTNAAAAATSGIAAAASAAAAEPRGLMGQSAPAAHSTSNDVPTSPRRALPGGSADSAAWAQARAPRAAAAADGAEADLAGDTAGASPLTACGSGAEETRAAVLPQHRPACRATSTAATGGCAAPPPVPAISPVAVLSGSDRGGRSPAGADGGVGPSHRAGEGSSSVVLGFEQQAGVRPAPDGTCDLLQPSNPRRGVEKEGGGEPSAGRCAGQPVELGSPFTRNVAQGQCSRASSAADGGSSWSGGRLPCAAAVVPRDARHRGSGGGSRQPQPGAAHAGGENDEGGGMAPCSNNCSSRQPPGGSGSDSGSGDGSAGHADDACSLFSLPISSAGSRAEAGAVARGVEAADSVALMASASTRCHALTAQQLERGAPPGPAAPEAVSAVRTAEYMASEGAPSVRGTSFPTVGEESPPGPEDGRLTWGSDAAADGGCGGGGGGGGGAAAGSGTWQRPRVRGRATVSPRGAADGTCGRSNESRSPQGSPGTVDAAVGQGGVVGSTSGGDGGGSGGGVTARFASTPEAGPGPGARTGARVRAQRARDAAGGMMAAHSSAWGTAAAGGGDRVWTYRNGSLRRAVRQVGA